MNVLMTFLAINQCAWCLCLMVDGRKIKDWNDLLPVSHGICLECVEKIV